LLPPVPAVMAVTVTTAPTDDAVTPTVPPLRLIAAARLVAETIAFAASVLPWPAMKNKPVLTVALLVSESALPPLVIVTVLPTSAPLLKVPDCRANAPEPVTPEELVV